MRQALFPMQPENRKELGLEGINLLNQVDIFQLFSKKKCTYFPRRQWPKGSQIIAVQFANIQCHAGPVDCGLQFAKTSLVFTDERVRGSNFPINKLQY